MKQPQYITGGIWEPKVGKPVRIAFMYESKIYPFIWVVVGKDGSIYLGKSANEKIPFAKKGRLSTQEGAATIKYNEGDEIQDPYAIKKAKVSFHASGIVKTNLPTDEMRTFNVSLRNISSPEYLCSILFQHPLQFKAIDMIRKQDIVLNYQFDEQCPLACDVYATPPGHPDLPLIRDAKGQVPIILQYRSLDQICDIEVRLLFYHNAVGTWPPYTYIVWKSELKSE